METFPSPLQPIPLEDALVFIIAKFHRLQNLADKPTEWNDAFPDPRQHLCIVNGDCPEDESESIYFCAMGERYVKQQRSPCCIYELVDPVTDEIRYVGKTSNYISRYAFHAFNISHDNECVHIWRHSLRKQGRLPIMRIIERCAKSDGTDREKHWIAERSKICPLCNIMSNPKAQESRTERRENEHRANAIRTVETAKPNPSPVDTKA